MVIYAHRGLNQRQTAGHCLYQTLKIGIEVQGYNLVLIALVDLSLTEGSSLSYKRVTTLIS